MSLQSIRDYYGVPVKRGMRITFRGGPARVLSASRDAMRLHVELEDGSRARIHPTWEVEYPRPRRGGSNRDRTD